jgi:hypothetical protein
MIRIFCTVISFFCIVHAHAQTPGLIYKPSTTAFGRSVLDPNGDGFTSPTNVGFITTDFGSGSELPMIPLPVIQGEPHSDLTTGASGGHTDIVSFPVGGQASNQSCYILYRTVNGVPYVLIRMRIGKASTSPKGYSFLLNTDGNFNTGSSGNNPGYDKEIVLQTGNPGLVAVYTHSGSATTLSASFPAAEYSQYSVALSANNGNPDYFYDFFVPFSSLGIAQNPVGITAVTVTSAGSGITGTISDFNGVNDQLYGGNPSAIMNALISSFPAIPLTELTEDFNPNTWLAQTLAPVVNTGLTPSSNSISGTSTESDGTVIKVYKNGVAIGTTTVSNGTWSLTGVSGLVSGDLITAQAQATGKTLSGLSNTVTVAVLQPCTLNPPSITARDNGQRRLSGTAPENSTVTIFRINSDGSIVQAVIDNTQGTNPTTASSTGAWGPISRFGANNTDFGNTTYIARATLNGCASDYSLISAGSNSVSTIAPQVMTTTIQASFTSTNVIIRNKHTSNANIFFYVNGQLQGTANNIVSEGEVTFTYLGFVAGDVVYARAMGTALNSTLSSLSNQVIVEEPTLQTLAPTITGTYTAGSGKTITGTSLEPAGTVITVYRNGVLIGTVTVSAYGTWQLTNQTLSTYDVLTAFAKANGKSLSSVSNAVTVQAAAPSAPTVTGNYVVGNTTISGGSGNTLVRIYVDGTIIGTATPVSGAWSLTGIAPGELYRGAIIHATNMVNGIESPISNEKEVTGVASFVITRPNGSPLGTVVSGDTLNIRIKAKEGLNGGGNDFTAFNNNVTLSATIPVIDGSGPTENFSNGVLGSNPGEKNITVGGAGSNKKVLVVNPNDPTAFGEADIEVLPALWRGRIDQNTAIDNTGHNKPANWAHNRIPASGANVKFADDAVQDMEIEDDYTWNDLDFNNKPFHVLIKDKNLKLNSISQRDGNEFKTTGNGSLIMEIEPGQSRVFYVANSGSNYLRITNTDNTSQDPVTFSVRVFDNFLSNGTSGGTVAIDDRVNRTWMISNNNPGFISSVELTFEWLPNHQSNSMGGYKLYHYENNTWNQVGNLDFSEVEGIRKGTIQYTGTFSPFAIGAPSALPVEYLGMHVICESDYVNVNWSTASEYNASHFDIETSSDGFNWSVSAAVAANGTTNQLSTYSHSIRNVPGILYYRLTQFDFDGKNETFVPVYHDCSRAGNRLIVYPNPASSNIHILIQAEENMDHAELEILDMFGRVIVKTPVTVKSGSIAIQLDIDTLSSGVYLVRLKNTHSNFETFKFIKE